MPKRKLKEWDAAMRPIKEDHPTAVINLMVFMNELLPLSDTFNDLIRPMLKGYIASKRFEFAKMGDEVTTTLWVDSGYVRLYKKSVDKNGMEIEETINFGIPGHVLMVPECFFIGKKCDYHIDIAKGTVVVSFTRIFFDEMNTSGPEVERLANMVLSIEMLAEKNMGTMMRMNSKDRYDLFIKLYGEQVNQFFKQKHIASFLGLSTVYLSRLRAARNRRSKHI